MKIPDLLARGDLVDLRPPPQRTSVAEGASWGAARTVEAPELVRLLTLSNDDPKWTHLPLRLTGAKVVGSLDLSHAVLTRPLKLRMCYFEKPIILKYARADVIFLTGCHVPGIDAYSLATRSEVRLNDGFTSTRTVNLDGASIGSQLICRGGSFSDDDGPAIEAPGLDTGSTVFFDQGFRARGQVSLLGARIGYQLSCRDATFTVSEGTALLVDAATTGGSVHLDRGFCATGEVNFRGARIGGQLNFRGGRFTNRDGFAIAADGITVAGKVLLDENCIVLGETNLAGAQIKNNLQLLHSTFSNPDGTAVRIDRANIGADAAFSGAVLTGRVALSGGGVQISGDLKFNDRFTANGEVDLSGARIGGNLDCRSATLAAPEGIAMKLTRSEIKKDVRWFGATLRGGLSLDFAHVGRWYDSITAWPRKNDLRLNGFTYAFIHAEPTITVKQRLDWLRRDKEHFVPQPYEELAAAYRREGHSQDAVKVQVSAQWQRRLEVRRPKDWLILRLVRIAWSALLRVTVGYGFRPWQIVGPIAVLFLFGWWWFSRAEAQGLINPPTNLEGEVTFHGARYTADLLIPGAGIGERARFIPMGAAAHMAVAYTLAGWALAAMLIAGLVGIFRRS
ncbi:hypothetical protein [Actinoplanes sp. NPDC023714]|uniref:hypothetical protein n=1 Tax=Actinoplanes sp. NPDC023714 TaxID=3154322 RepID=UPI0033D6BE78